LDTNTGLSFKELVKRLDTENNIGNLFLMHSSIRENRYQIICKNDSGSYYSNIVEAVNNGPSITKVEDAMKLTVTSSDTSSLSMEVETMKNKIIDTGFHNYEIRCLMYWTNSDKEKGEFFTDKSFEFIDGNYNVDLTKVKG
jgi:hypothetical protein